jgi:hypothetical protein
MHETGRITSHSAPPKVPQTGTPLPHNFPRRVSSDVGNVTNNRSELVEPV